GVVVAVGDSTVLGRISKLTSSSRHTATVLQHEISRFVLTIAGLAIVTAVTTLLLWTFWLRVSYPGFLNLPGALDNAIGVLVAFVPEGMPVAVTLSLTIIAKRMYRQHILAKNLTTVETLGSVNVICSDKTGTLTQNRMFVACVGMLDSTFDVLKAADIQRLAGAPAFERLVQAAALCNAAQFDAATAGQVAAPHERKVNGNATDGALLRFVEQYRSVDALRAAWTKQLEIPFNSQNKWMLAMCKPREGDAATADVLVKGAPDVLLPRCASVLRVDGTVAPLDDVNRDRVRQLQERWSSEGQRVLLLCHRSVGDDMSEPLRKEGNLSTDVVGEMLNQSLCVVAVV
ncbi:MAG TPA: HAD-IC family P-type ATPase, partial [Polyangiales bacterium]|nr:HAD-IC family P-type ATPase [Polyangiales bacterium]